MNLLWTPEAWEDYLYWQQHDKKMFKRINQLLEDTKRHPFEGIGKPEALKHNLQGCWSRKIDSEHRLVYEAEDVCIKILACRYHY